VQLCTGWQVELAPRHVYALATSDGVKHELLLAPDTSDIPSSADTKQLRDALTAARLALRTSVIAIAASQPAQMSRLQRMPVVSSLASAACLASSPVVSCGSHHDVGGPA
jgi:hypothetical protein